MLRWKIIVLYALSLLLVIGVSTMVLQAEEDRDLRPVAGASITVESPWQITDSNLVDVLSALPLQLKLARAEIKGNTLAIDLKVLSSIDGTSPMYRDMAKLGKLALGRSGNIVQLRLRYVAEDPWTGNRHLLLAAELNREELSGDLDQVLSQLETDGDAPLTDSIKERLHIVETTLWKKTYPEADA